MTGSGVIVVFFIREWPEIWELEIPPSELCPICRDHYHLPFLSYFLSSVQYSFSLKSNLHAYTQNSQNSSLNFYRFHCCLSFYHLFKVVKASNHAWVLSLTLRLHHDLLLSICSWVIGVGPTLETYRYVVLKRFPGKIHHDPLQYVKTLNIKNKKFQVTQ